MLSYTNVLFFKIPINDSFIYSSSSWLNSNRLKSSSTLSAPGHGHSTGHLHPQQGISFFIDLDFLFPFGKSTELKIFCYQINIYTVKHSIKEGIRKRKPHI